jgi:hypothetical protein
MCLPFLNEKGSVFLFSLKENNKEEKTWIPIVTFVSEEK